MLDAGHLAIGEHVADVGHNLCAERRREPHRVDRVQPRGTWSKPATHVTANRVLRAMTELAMTNTSDSARDRSMWLLRAKFETFTRV